MSSVGGQLEWGFPKMRNARQLSQVSWKCELALMAAVVVAVSGCDGGEVVGQMRARDDLEEWEKERKNWEISRLFIIALCHFVRAHPQCETHTHTHKHTHLLNIIPTLYFTILLYFISIIHIFASPQISYHIIYSHHQLIAISFSQMDLSSSFGQLGNRCEGTLNNLCNLSITDILKKGELKKKKKKKLRGDRN